MSAKVKERSDSRPATSAKSPATSAARRPSAIGLIVAAIVIVLALLAGVLFLSGLATSDAARRDGSGDAANPSLAIDPDPDEVETAEVALGEFNPSNGTASPGSIIHVNLKISAVTAAHLASTLEKRLKSHQARIRQIVDKIVRSSNLNELNDPNLGTIKRMIREDVNRLLRKSYVIEIVITDVRIIEQ